MTDSVSFPADLPPFDEEEYLNRHRDVVAAIAEGKYASGLEHFERYGRAEGRQYVARASGGARVTFGRVRGFSPALPGPARHAIDVVLMAEEGWIFIVGWADDRQDKLASLLIEGRDWAASIDASALARVGRNDVRQALGLSSVQPLGFLALIHAGARLNGTAECRISFEWEGREPSAVTAPVIRSGLRELREQVLGHIGGTADGGSQVTAMLSLEPGLGEQVVALNRATTSGIIANPFVERFGKQESAPKASIIVCIYGRPEYVFTQNALFAGKPGIEDYEFIYVCNSPELVERLLKEAACSSTIYGLRQTIVGLPANAGFGAANNVGVGAARGKRIVCLNPDVFPRNLNWAARHTALVDSGREGSRLFGAALYYDDGALMHGGMYLELDTGLAVQPGLVQSHGFARVEHYGKGAPPDCQEFLRPRPVPAVSGAFISTDRSWYEALGGFCEDYVLGHYEDADLCLRSRAAGVPAWMQDIRMWHLEGQGSKRNQVQGGATIVNRWLFSRRWRDEIANGLRGPSPRLRPVRESAPAEAAA